MTTTREAVIAAFSKEFASLASLFDVSERSLASSYDSGEHTDRPGVYVHWYSGEVLRIGRSLSNARTRALERIRDDTGKRMAALKHNSDAWLLLFTVRSPSHLHWVVALEVFLENALMPSIPSKRTG